MLLSMGKENLYVWEKHENMLHEDEAVEYLRRICSGEHVASGSPKEGKIDLTAACDGVLKIDTEKLYQVNSLGEMMICHQTFLYSGEKRHEDCRNPDHSTGDRERKDGRSGKESRSGADHGGCAISVKNGGSDHDRK